MWPCLRSASPINRPCQWRTTLGPQHQPVWHPCCCAARPVTWRGAGELLQVSWATPPKGAWLVVDMWAGFSGLCIALLSLGFHFYAIAAECEEEARRCASAVMPSIVHTSDVCDVTAEVLLAIIRKRRMRGIIVGGGSPCQPNSVLNT